MGPKKPWTCSGPLGCSLSPEQLYKSPAIGKSPFWVDYEKWLQEENDAGPALCASRRSCAHYPAEASDVREQSLILAELWPPCTFLNKINDCCCLGCVSCSTKPPPQLEVSFGWWCCLVCRDQQELAMIWQVAEENKSKTYWCQEGHTGETTPTQTTEETRSDSERREMTIRMCKLHTRMILLSSTIEKSIFIWAYLLGINLTAHADWSQETYSATV